VGPNGLSQKMRSCSALELGNNLCTMQTDYGPPVLRFVLDTGDCTIDSSLNLDRSGSYLEGLPNSGQHQDTHRHQRRNGITGNRNDRGRAIYSVTLWPTGLLMYFTDPEGIETF